MRTRNKIVKRKTNMAMTELTNEYRYFDHTILFTQNDYYFFRKVLSELISKDHKSESPDAPNSFFHQFDVHESTINRCTSLINKLNVMIEHGNKLSEEKSSLEHQNQKEV